ncbi:MAG TPA: hypothetical protein VLY46_03765 [Usitatibacter sp.]|nr:hypothetical protein [Usitatibacter sp.]
MQSLDRDRWMTELHQHEFEMERLALEVKRLEDAASGCTEVGGEQARQLRRRAEFAVAQRMRHGISVALLASRLGHVDG